MLGYLKVIIMIIVKGYVASLEIEILKNNYVFPTLSDKHSYSSLDILKILRSPEFAIV